MHARRDTGSNPAFGSANTRFFIALVTVLFQIDRTDQTVAYLPVRQRSLYVDHRLAVGLQQIAFQISGHRLIDGGDPFFRLVFEIDFGEHQP